MVKDFTRKITHTFKDYSNTVEKRVKQGGKLSSIVDKRIHSKEFLRYKDGLVNNSRKQYVDQNFIWLKHPHWTTPLLSGGVSLMFALGLLLIPTSEPLGKTEWFIIFFCSFLTFFFLFMD